MKSLRTKIAAIVIAVAAIVAVPAAASAYTPVPPSGGTATIPPGGTQSFLFPTTGLTPGEEITYTLEGEGVTGANLAMVKFAPATATKNLPQGVAVTVTLPTNATGTYQLSAAGATSGTVLPGVTITASSSGTGTIGNQGFDAGSMLGVWIGGGVLLLGGVLVTVFAARRERQDV